MGGGVAYGLYAPNAPNLIDPAVFGGAGAASVRALRSLDIPRKVRPDAIVVASPHWVSGNRFLVESSARPKTIHDFSGFPRQLYEVRYDAPGDPEFAARLAEVGRSRKLDVEATADWGIDHGAWATLLHVAPERDIPVVPLSIAVLPPADHRAWGEAIRTAAEAAGKRIAVVGTGSITHRLDMFHPARTEPWPEGEAIEQEIVGHVLARRYEALERFDPEKWATVAPEGDLAPLFVVIGAVGPRAVPRLVAHEQLFGSVGMTTIEWTVEGDG